MVLGGPAFEYYSNLAHFSVGLDADIFYAIGFDLGANAIGYMKYTFIHIKDNNKRTPFFGLFFVDEAVVSKL